MKQKIPPGWSRCHLDEVADFLDNKRVPIKESDRTGMQGEYPYYGASGIIDYVNDFIFDEELVLLGEDGANILNRSTPLAFRVSGKCWVNNHAHVIRPRPSIDMQWLTEYLESLDYRKYNSGPTQPKLNREICESIPILQPPVVEQKKIGTIAALWDRAINLTERLLAEKRLRRKGLMQQLLTGKRRLPGFEKSKEVRYTRWASYPADWGYPRIGEVAKHISIKNQGGASLPVLSCTKHRGLVDSMVYFGKQVFSKDLSTYKVVQRGQFAYATNHIEEGSIGYQDLYDTAVISPMYTVFEAGNKIDDRFLFLLLKTERYRHIFESNTSASVDRRGSLRWPEFSLIHVPLPTLDEQRAIVTVINVADRELALLQGKADALREQKKGLMQQLLTGKRRVKI